MSAGTHRSFSAGNQIGAGRRARGLVAFLGDLGDFMGLNRECDSPEGFDARCADCKAGTKDRRIDKWIRKLSLTAPEGIP